MNDRDLMIRQLTRQRRIEQIEDELRNGKVIQTMAGPRRRKLSKKERIKRYDYLDHIRGVKIKVDIHG